MGIAPGSHGVRVAPTRRAARGVAMEGPCSTRGGCTQPYVADRYMGVTCLYSRSAIFIGAAPEIRWEL